MKSFSFQGFLDQKKVSAHVVIAFFSLLGSVFFYENFLYFFILLFIQIELFLFIGTRVFQGVKIDFTEKKLTSKVILILTLYLILCFVVSLIITVVFGLFVNKSFNSLIINFVEHDFKGWLVGTISGFIFGTAIFLFILWQDSLKREQKLREENLIFQNETLKNQINPHFLFNSLNTLSSLFHSRPESAEEFISKLSSIYRYILKHSSRNKISLADELLFVKNYFFLHKIRSDEKIQLEIKVQEPDTYEILPVSLQILVENAIKHNRATREEPLNIYIYIEGQFIVVKNNLQKMGTQIGSTGIGLKNLAERVKFISKKSLKIEESNNCFLVKIPLL